MGSKSNSRGGLAAGPLDGAFDGTFGLRRTLPTAGLCAFDGTLHARLRGLSFAREEFCDTLFEC